MDKLEELYLKERELQEKEDNIFQEQKQFQQIRELSESHLYETKRFIEESIDLFQGTEQGHFYESVMEEFSKESYRFTEDLEERSREIQREKANAHQELEDFAYEKREALDKEGRDEY